MTKEQFYVEWQTVSGMELWKLLRKRVEDNLAQSMNRCATNNDEMEIRRCQGQARALGVVLGLLDNPDRLYMGERTVDTTASLK